MIKILSIGLIASLSGLALCTPTARASIAGLTNTGVDFDPTTLVDKAWTIVGGTNSLGSPYSRVCLHQHQQRHISGWSVGG